MRRKKVRILSSTVFLIIVAGVVTFGLRALPFIVFGGKREMPPFLKRVADLMPAAIMAVLVIYCVKGDIASIGMSSAVTAVSILAVILLHLWKRNILISIFGGTALYMMMLHLLPGLM